MRSPREPSDARATRAWSDDDPISPPTIRSAARIHYHYFIFLSDRAHDENKGRRVIVYSDATAKTARPRDARGELSRDDDSSFSHYKPDLAILVHLSFRV